jgi:SWI/SNF-related matrix-associated actin-dependent regulator 1 of chromatin subfamily A
MVASLRAGGVGHTLTAASNVAFIEFGWTPSLLDQAEDRCHRIGQSSSVTCYYFQGLNTIDEDILELINQKREIVTKATEGGDEVEKFKIFNELVGRIVSMKKEKDETFSGDERIEIVPSGEEKKEKREEKIQLEGIEDTGDIPF